MSIDWTKPLVVAGTDRAATLQDTTDFRALVWSADWGSGQSGNYSFDMETGKGLVAFDLAVANAPPTPKIGPEHIEALDMALAVFDAAMRATIPAHKHQDVLDEGVPARLAEIRTYLESL